MDKDFFIKNKDGIYPVIEKAAALLKSAGADGVYLFGSTTEGTRRSDSDIDLAVEGLPPEIFYQVVGMLLLELPCSIDLVDLDQELPFTRYLKQKGKLIRVA